jgi:hypothetical protein
MRLRELKLHLPSNKSIIFLQQSSCFLEKWVGDFTIYAGSIKSVKGINLEKKAKISYNLEHGAASNRALFSQETIFFAIFQEYNFGDMVSGTSQSTLG